MIKALIGYTGFVGSSHDFSQYDYLINSSNIETYVGLEVDLMVVAAGDARKWHANQNPENDFDNIIRLYNALTKIKAKHVILYSTVDVINTTKGVANEDSLELNYHPYGMHRFMLELMVSNFFKKVQIIRLPGLFGAGLKKNLIFDIKNKRLDQLRLYHFKSEFQFFNMNYADELIEKVFRSNIPLVHITSDKISVEELLKVLSPDYLSLLDRTGSPIKYNFQTKYPEINPSVNTKSNLIDDIIQYCNS